MGIEQINEAIKEAEAELVAAKKAGDKEQVKLANEKILHLKKEAKKEVAKGKSL